MNNLSIIIPAAGLGLRVGNSNPKILTKLENEDTILSRNLYLVSKIFPLSEIVIVVGFQKNKIIKYLNEQKINNRIKIVHNLNFEKNNVGQSLNLGIQKASYNNILIIYGDLIFNQVSLTELPLEEEKTFLVIDHNNLMNSDEVGICIENNKIQELNYNYDQKWCQIAYLNKWDKQLFLKITYNNCWIEKLFGFEIFNKMIKKGTVFKQVIIEKMKLIELDTFKDLKKIKEKWQDFI